VNGEKGRSIEKDKRGERNDGVSQGSGEFYKKRRPFYEKFESFGEDK
jgi:hypothetical protein